MRIDSFVKESFPRVESLKEMNSISRDTSDDGYVVVFKKGMFAGIGSFSGKKKINKPLLVPKAELGERVNDVLCRMDDSGRPVLPVFDSERFVGVVTKQVLERSKESLGMERESGRSIAENQALTEQVAMLQAELNELKSWTERANQARGVSCSLMRTSLTPLSLNAQLGEALDLIFSVPWVSVQSRGSIFLADANGTLHMAVSRGLSDYLLTACKTVAPGFCLCGRAAESRKPVFASTIDHRHDITYEGIQPHGHYCYPILSQDRLLGVLNLYLAEDHVYDPEEEDFLLSTANILAGLIERKQVEDDLRMAKEEAESASLAKTSFLANVSHEIRTPLNAIVGFSRILLKHQSQISPRFLQYLENIRVSGVSLTEIINNVLDLAKIEAGKVEMDEEDVDIRLLLQSLYHIVKDRAAEKGVGVRYNIDPTLPKKVRIDRTRLNQVLMNLADNAVKFTAKGQEVSISLIRDNQEMVFQVQDEGVGIPEDRIEEVFNPFEQADGSTTRQHGGTGLGLAIVRSLVEILGGSVSVESQVGVGSTFSVRLPLHEIGSREDVVESVDWRSYVFRPGVKILLVEDNPMNQEMLLAVLDDVGLVAQIAENGQDGVEMAFALRPDLILMDLHMPVMDGLSAARKIRENPDFAELPIIGLSADAFVEREGQAQDAGISHFLTKPVDLDALMPLIMGYLGADSDGTGQETPKVTEQPLPADVVEQVVAGLDAIAALPLFESGKIVDLCESLSDLCADYGVNYGVGFDRIRDAVYSRDSKSIPAIIQEVLADFS